MLLGCPSICSDLLPSRFKAIFTPGLTSSTCEAADAAQAGSQISTANAREIELAFRGCGQGSVSLKQEEETRRAAAHRYGKTEQQIAGAGATVEGRVDHRGAGLTLPFLGCGFGRLLRVELCQVEPWKPSWAPLAFSFEWALGPRY